MQIKLSNFYLFKKYLKPYWLHIIAATIALAITASSVLALGKGLGYLIDKGFAAGGDPKLLNIALISLILIVIVLAFGTFTRFFLVSYVGEKAIAAIRTEIYNHIINLSAEFYETAKSGDILSRIISDTSLLQVIIGSSFSVALRNTIMLIGGTILLFHTSLKLSLIVAVVVPLVVLPIILLGRKLRRLSKATQEKIGEISAHAEETINGIKTIQAYSRQQLEVGIFSKITEQALNVAVRRIFLRAFLTALVILFVFGSIAFVLWIGGSDVVNGKMSAGQLSSFIFYSVLVASAFGAITEVFGDLQRASGAMERIKDILNTMSNVVEAKNPTQLPEKSKHEIIFKDVSFAYPGQVNNLSLKDFNFTISSGETIAIVGPSGAGKSTIFQLLLRFYDVTKGTISVDNIDIKSLQLIELRNLFAIVPQDTQIFSGSAYDNIAIGKEGATFEEVVAAAKNAAAYDFIIKLPNGFDTFLGEKGVRLSGGEKQRIAIARAFLRDPKFLLLDEATSALDNQNEALVQLALKRLMQNRGTIIIAHRLSTVSEADRIIVLENGKVVESGTHEELSKIKGSYHKMSNVK